MPVNEVVSYRGAYVTPSVEVPQSDSAVVAGTAESSTGMTAGTDDNAAENDDEEPRDARNTTEVGVVTRRR